MSKEVPFNEWLCAAIKGWHPDWEDKRIQSNVNTLYTAAQNFPDDNGDMELGAAQQIMSLLKVWRYYDLRYEER